jgi:hypothetical protein
MEPDQVVVSGKRMDVNNVFLLYIFLYADASCLYVCCIYSFSPSGYHKIYKSISGVNDESSILYQFFKELRETHLNSSFKAPTSPTSCSHQQSQR